MAPKKIDYLNLANQNINYRDKFLKIFQYSSRFLMGFYSDSLTPEGAEQLRMSVHNVLLVRRAARYCFFMIFFKNALAKMQKMANDDALLDWSPNAGLRESGDGALVESIEVLEQLVWGVFYFLDTVILAARLHVIDWPEESLFKMMEGIYFPLWIAGDTTIFAKSLVRLHRNARRRKLVEDELILVQGLTRISTPYATPISSPNRGESLVNGANGTPRSDYHMNGIGGGPVSTSPPPPSSNNHSYSPAKNGNASITAPLSPYQRKLQQNSPGYDRDMTIQSPNHVRGNHHTIQELNERLHALDDERRKVVWTLVKSMIDMCVSSSFNPNLKTKPILGDWWVGVCGTISAIMAMTDEACK